jgi:hypothetical protein
LRASHAASYFRVCLKYRRWRRLGTAPSVPIAESPLAEAQALDDLRAGGVVGRVVLTM